MTTKYVIKKCNSFGFAKNISEATKLYGNSGLYLLDNEDGVNNIIGNLPAGIPNGFINNIEHVPGLTNIHNINDIPTDAKVIYVRLGKEVNRPIKIPVEGDDTELLNNSEYNKLLLQIYNSDEPVIDKLPGEIINAIIDIYPKTISSTFRHKLIDLLQFNNVNTIQLIKDFPFQFTEENADIIVNDGLFTDIEVSTDKSDPNTTNNNYRPDKDALKNAALGNTTQLDAFSENKFAVIHTKKNAGIDNKTRSMNHDVIDTLAVNGVIRAPETKKPLSIYLLMKKLEQLHDFNICFIHPSYELKRLSAECPCEQIIPVYRIGEGEILAVAYRYLCLWFFAYCSIFTDSMLEYRYVI